MVLSSTGAITDRITLTPHLDTGNYVVKVCAIQYDFPSLQLTYMMMIMIKRWNGVRKFAV